MKARQTHGKDDHAPKQPQQEKDDVHINDLEALFQRWILPLHHGVRLTREVDVDARFIHRLGRTKGGIDGKKSRIL